MLPHLLKLFDRDIRKLKMEIELYEKEKLLWKISGNITNSAGNLCLHLIGNLNYYLGSILGNTGYIRNRNEEFTDKNIGKSILLKNIDETLQVVVNTLNNLQEEDLLKQYPIKVFEDEMTIAFFLLHLHGHLTYHLGQINYHRRLIDYL